MKTALYTYTRNEYGKLVSYMGVFDMEMSSKYDYIKIYHPVLDGGIMLGTCHSNAENVKVVGTITLPAKLYGYDTKDIFEALKGDNSKVINN